MLRRARKFATSGQAWPRDNLEYSPDHAMEATGGVRLHTTDGSRFAGDVRPPTVVNNTGSGGIQVSLFHLARAVGGCRVFEGDTRLLCPRLHRTERRYDGSSIGVPSLARVHATSSRSSA